MISATASHRDRARLAKVVLACGRAVASEPDEIEIGEVVLNRGDGGMTEIIDAPSDELIAFLDQAVYDQLEAK